ncbi:serine proteinase stubble isoform X3 [Amyelois transitella]|uniref:serine proteinase stubble isoform X3 n=1 Tax=Amyelois transitella TaxID=680683 RepID=UPI0029906C5A|nr:serine proteinase stubble isoform X3 [Amyelois transitella]
MKTGLSTAKVDGCHLFFDRNSIFLYKISAVCVLVILAGSWAQQQEAPPLSPCPNVFSYEPPGTEPGRWYGVVNLSTDSTLHSLWLNIVLDRKADILGNWVGDVSTTDNTDFKIENTKMKIHPGPAVAVRFFVQYSPLNPPVPKLKAIRLNGREICNADTPVPVQVYDAEDRPSRPESSSYRPTSRQTERPRPNDQGLRPNDQNSRPSDQGRPNNQGIRPNEGSRPGDDVSRPVDTYNRPTSRPSRPTSGIRPQDEVTTRPVQGTPSQDGPVYVRPPQDAVPSKIDNDPPRRNININQPTSYLTPSPPFRTTSTVRNDPEDFDDPSRPVDPSEYFGGGQPTIVVPANGGNGQSHYDRDVQQNECGKVVRQNPNALVINGAPTYEGEWPWQIALYQTQTIDYKYICGGTLVSHRHVITAAHCVTLKNRNRVVNKGTLTVYLGKHNLRTSTTGVEIRAVEDIITHPQYNATSFSRDLAVLVLRDPVQYTDWVRPVCLWPENLVDISNIINKKGSVVGWGFDETGSATEELNLVEMPIVNQLTCIKSYPEFFVRYTSEYTYCAGYRNGVYNKDTGTVESSSVCNGDSGGGMVFKIDDRWYLRGLVSLSVSRHNERRCDPQHYIVFTDLAKFLPWLKQHIADY